MGRRSCRRWGNVIVAQQRVLPSWPRERYLELAPAHWRATRARLNPAELDMPISSFEVPPVLAAPAPSAASI